MEFDLLRLSHPDRGLGSAAQRFVLVFVLLAALARSALAQGPGAPAALLWDLARLEDGRLLALLWLTPTPGYKVYAHDPGQTGLPLNAQAVLGPTGQALPVLYPPGRAVKDTFEQNLTVNVHDGPTPLFVPLPADPPRDWSLAASVNLLACSETSCWPAALETTLSSRQGIEPVRAEAQTWWPRFAELIRDTAGTRADRAASRPEARAEAPAPIWTFTPRSPAPRLEVDSLLRAVPLAVLAGVILNLMPCVLPVVCLKLAGLLALCRTDEHRRRQELLRTHNLYFSLGILAYFLVLAVILGLAGLAWGQLFQRPGFILGAAVVLFALGLSLFGVFHLPVVDLKHMAAGDENPRLQSFLTGVMATLLATPCSGPFLGGVLAWTMLQPVAVVMTVFFCIGLGMAAPFMLLAARPELVRFVPRPGSWMTQLEKLAGFLVLAASLYFLIILPADVLPWALAALLVTALGCHVWGSLTGPSQSRTVRWGIRGLAVGLSVAACLFALRPSAAPQDLWRPFEPQDFARTLGRERLLVDFTADWCPTCKALETTVLTPKAVATLRETYGFTAVRVDLTREDPQAMALLRALGSASIPVAALFPDGDQAGSPVVLRDLFTAGQLEAAMRQTWP